MEKKLKKEKDIPCYVCSHIFKNTKPVLLVSREDGDWQFLCGDEHENDSIPHLVGLSHLFERDIRLKDIRALPVNWEIKRDDENLQWKIISTG